MSKCIDRRDQVTQNTLATSLGPFTNFDGEYTLNQIDVFAEELAQNIIDNSKGVRFDGDLDAAANYLNGLYKDLINDRLGDFTDVGNRWNRGNITTIELADFIDSYNYTPQGVIDQTDYLKLLRELNNYYKGSIKDSLMGGFCNTLQNIFQQIDAFYDLLGTVEGIINDALALIAKIQEFDGFPPEIAEQGLIRFLINELKSQATKIINAVFKDVEDAIANFDVQSIIGEFESGALESAKAIATAKEQMCAFFTDENKKTLKDKVEGFIDYAMSLFESPNLDSVRYFAYRFCALMTNIELLIKDIKRPLDDYGFRFQRIVRRMQAISKINTSTAIRNGAIRYSPERRQESINRLRALWNGEGDDEVITPTGEELQSVKPITVEEYQNLPTCGKVFKDGDKGIKVEGDWVEDLGITGYTRIDLDVKVYLMRLQKELGRDITITRGWYSKDYNDKVEGDPENSHLSGLVIDIKNDFSFDIPSEDLDIVTSIESMDDFTEKAFKSGFKYVVVRDDEIHLDIREVPR